LTRLAGPGMKTGLFYGALLVSLWLALELGSWGTLRVLPKLKGIHYEPIDVTSLSDEHRRILSRFLEGSTAYVGYSATLGWTIKPGGAASPLYQANAQGFRATREYSTNPGPGIRRVAAFGDSFTHGDGVGNSETWAEMLSVTAPGLEVLNFGVGGYGIDQALLRYRQEGKHFHPHIVLIGFMSENINRSVNVYRPFYAPGTGQPLAKPRFRIKAGRLSALDNPIGSLEEYQQLLDDTPSVLARLGESDYFYGHRAHASPWDFLPSVRLLKLSIQEIRLSSEPIIRGGRYNRQGEAFAVTSAILDAFVAEVRADAARPLILVFPARPDLRDNWSGGIRVYQPLLDDFRAKGYEYVDLLDAFERCRNHCAIDSLVPGHYSAAGNRMIADFLRDFLNRTGELNQP